MLVSGPLVSGIIDHPLRTLHPWYRPVQPVMDSIKVIRTPAKTRHQLSRHTLPVSTEYSLADHYATPSACI
jgi:hypothetical protein